MATQDSELKIEAKLDRETKNALRFAETDKTHVGDRPAVGTIYVLKSEAERIGVDPQKGVEVTVRPL